MKASVGSRVLMLLENNPYPQDGRVRQEATTLVSGGYQVSVICPKRSGQPWHDVHNGVDIYRFPEPPQANGFLGYLWEYSYAMIAMFLFSLFVFLRKNFDIVHTHNPPDTLVFIATCYKLLGKRFIYDHHDLVPEMYDVLFENSNRFVYQVQVWLERLSCRLADRVITTNQSYKHIEMQRGSIPESRITIVRNGPDLSRLQPVTPDPKLRQKSKTTICYVGEMGFHDGLDYLLRALHLLGLEVGRTDFFCVLVGGGDAWPNVKLLSEELGLSDFVLFTGRVSHETVAHYLSAADICVAPEPSNPYNDHSTMIKMMEYMALRKPIVAFDLPEHRFTAQDAAVYARPNDELDFARQIARLMDNPEQRQKMGQIGRERIETELAWIHQEQHLLKAYEALDLPEKQSVSVRT